ncbi:MAG: hypothetical protein QXO57_03905 [Candidatus Aenigmatarchaeota archaeon]
MKGQAYTIEALVAISILVFIILVLISFPSKQAFSLINYKIQFLNTLKSLDDLNLLRDAALRGDSTFIEEEIKNFVPANIKFNVTIFNKTTNITSLPLTEGPTAIISYIIAGKIGNYTPRELRVYFWGFS